MRRAWFAAAIVVVVVAAAGIGFAAGHAPSGEITVCTKVVKGDTKITRVVNVPTDCTGKEHPLTWNAEGEQGEQGEKGDQGDPGPAGTQPTTNSVITIGGTNPIAATGSDGLAVIAYTLSSKVELLHCGNPTCTSGNVTNELSNSSSGVQHMVIGSNGKPALIEFDGGLNQYVYVACGNLVCSSGNVFTAILPVDSVPDFAIGTDGKPVIAYHDLNGLQLMHCSLADCSGTNTTEQASPVNIEYGQQSSIAIGTDGFPIVADVGPGSFVYTTHCGDATCSTGNVTTFHGDASDGPQIVIGTDELPDIGFHAGSQRDVLHCSDAACTATATPTVVATTNGLRLARDPVSGQIVALYPTVGGMSGLLIEASFADAALSSMSDRRVVDPSTFVQQAMPAVAILPDGKVVAAYQDSKTLLRVSYG